jgi:hypothetical protein
MTPTDRLLFALARGARAFADALDEADIDSLSDLDGRPAAGSAESMAIVLSGVARINDEEQRGVRTQEMRSIATAGGMDMRGTAGYFAADLISMDNDGRWLTDAGRKRLEHLGTQ